MQKIWTIARREYQAMVATKAFLISLIMMPVMMFGSILVQTRFRDSFDASEKTIVVADGTGGTLFSGLQQAAETRNAAIDAARQASAEPRADVPPALFTGPKYVLQEFRSATLSDEQRLELSNQVRRGEIQAFVEIPENALESARSANPPSVRFYAASAVLATERQWLDRSINDQLSTRRLLELDLDPATIKKATAPVRMVPLGLFKKAADGSVRGADESRNIAGILVPFGFMMLMFMIIMLSAQPLIEGVMEEKAGRIAEVLLGSANAFQLMLGKLLGNVAGSLSVVAIYAVGGYAVARYSGWLDIVPMELVPWFMVFQVLAVLLFGSMFLAVGAAVNSLKEAQTIMLPIWIMMILPMMLSMQLVREPNSTVATAISFFPPATPLAMVLRLASEAAIPAWQPIAGVLVLTIATIVCVYFAGRVFRIGILWQGKTPHLRELCRWALRG